MYSIGFVIGSAVTGAIGLGAWIGGGLIMKYLIIGG